MGAMFRFHIRSLVILGLLLICAAGAVLAADRERLDITTRDGVRSFSVELADTPESQNRGLMYRRSLPPAEGMLFDFGSEQRINMWMKNTFIPLDMIFIGADGRIRRIAENTTPFSTRIISSGEPVRYVLEVNAGTARELGIAKGDLVLHRAISPAR
jgi:uncharacterized membrane protein (UPF0127 family)